MLNKVFSILLIITVLTLVHYFKTDYSNKEDNADVPHILHYRIGTIDPRFKISADEVKYLAYQATQIWEKGTGEVLFQYDPEAKLSINLIYDERQQSTEYIDQMNATMSKKSEDLDQFNRRLEHQQLDLQQRRTALQQEYLLLQQERAEWSMVEFSSGENMQRLNQKEQQLDVKRNQISEEWDSYHLNVKLYNEKVEAFNQHAQHAREYNQRSAPRLFHKGTFSGEGINIYQINSKNDLKVTLAHEFGHALGMAHHQDPKALMYPSVAEQDVDHFKLLPADLTLFQQRQSIRFFDKTH